MWAQKRSLYADDLVIHGRRHFHVQQILQTLHSAISESRLSINQIKIEIMKFRKNGLFKIADFV